jgi:hypothetical protein
MAKRCFESQKSTKIYEHSAFLGTALNVAIAGYDIREGVKNKERPLTYSRHNNKRRLTT